MIQEMELGSEKVMTWHIEGKIDQVEYASITDSLNQKMKTSSHLNIFLEMPKMPGFTPQAIWESIKFGFANMKEYVGKIDKFAVVTDKEWLKTYADIENRLFTGIEERAFSFEDAEKAKQWVREGK